MSKETDTDSTSRCSASSVTPNYYCNAKQATELNRCGSDESSANKEGWWWESSRNNCSAFFKHYINEMRGSNKALLLSKHYIPI